MRGDVLFFTPGRNDLTGIVVARATKGPFCHVAIDRGDGYIIQARLRGITLDEQARATTKRWSPPSGIDQGFLWLDKQVGDRYGILDIFDQLLRLVFHTTLYVAQPRSYDCSDLATRYLMHCGVDLGPLADAPHLVTPNDLARQLGVQ